MFQTIIFLLTISSSVAIKCWSGGTTAQLADIFNLRSHDSPLFKKECQFGINSCMRASILAFNISGTFENIAYDCDYKGFYGQGHLCTKIYGKLPDTGDRYVLETCTCTGNLCTDTNTRFVKKIKEDFKFSKENIISVTPAMSESVFKSTRTTRKVQIKPKKVVSRQVENQLELPMDAKTLKLIKDDKRVKVDAQLQKPQLEDDTHSVSKRILKKLSAGLRGKRVVTNKQEI